MAGPPSHPVDASISILLSIPRSHEEPHPHCPPTPHRHRTRQLRRHRTRLSHHRCQDRRSLRTLQGRTRILTQTGPQPYPVLPTHSAGQGTPLNIQIAFTEPGFIPEFFSFRLRHQLHESLSEPVLASWNSEEETFDAVIDLGDPVPPSPLRSTLSTSQASTASRSLSATTASISRSASSSPLQKSTSASPLPNPNLQNYTILNLPSS